jgi:BRCT domain type II-containing protein
LPSTSPDSPGRLPLAGQLVVFTGKLSSLGRKDAADLVTRLGGATADDVNAKTTMVVIGAEGFGVPSTAEQAVESAAGVSRIVREKSKKLKRAEDLNAQQPDGAAIQIVTEEEFCRLAGVATP